MPVPRTGHQWTVGIYASGPWEEAFRSGMARSERQVSTFSNMRTVPRQSVAHALAGKSGAKAPRLSKTHQRAFAIQSEAHQDASVKPWAEIEQLWEESRSPLSYVSARKWSKHRCAFSMDQCQIVPDKCAIVWISGIIDRKAESS
jgi:hypothetical protein